MLVSWRVLVVLGPPRSRVDDALPAVVGGLSEVVELEIILLWLRYSRSINSLLRPFLIYLFESWASEV